MASRGAGFVPRGLQSDARQVFDQATRNMINAFLRRESGATISDEEFDNARQQYIPQPGDDEAVLAVKRDNRNAMVASLRTEAGDNLYQEVLENMGPPSTHILNGKVYVVGQVYTNDRGEKFKINPDGTATLVE